MKKGILSLITLLFLSISTFANSGADAILGEWLSQDKDGKIIISSKVINTLVRSHGVKHQAERILKTQMKNYVAVNY
jgi:hypothetical protein